MAWSMSISCRVSCMCACRRVSIYTMVMVMVTVLAMLLLNTTLPSNTSIYIYKQPNSQPSISQTYIYLPTERTKTWERMLDVTA